MHQVPSRRSLYYFEAGAVELTMPMLTAEPEPESTPEPEQETAGEPEVHPEGCPRGEPLPEWPEAKEAWGGAWELHAYGTAILFLLLTLVAVYHAIRIGRMSHFPSKCYFMVLNILIMTFSLARSVYYFVDAYNYKRIYPQAVAMLTENIAFPCLGSAFTILLAALLKTTKYEKMSSKILAWQVLLAIVLFTFMLSVTADLVTVFILDSNTFLVVCRVIFIVWGLLFTGAYFYIFAKLSLDVIEKKKEWEHDPRVSTDSSSVLGVKVKVPKPRIPLALKISAFTSACFLMVSILNIAFMALGNRVVERPWTWWVLAFLMRLAEVGMSVTILGVAALPIYRR